MDFIHLQYNPLLDNEAQDDDDNEAEYNSDFEDNSNDFNLHLDVSDEDEDGIEKEDGEGKFIWSSSRLASL